VVRRYVRTGTIPITPTPARRTASTVRNGSLAECLSVSAPGMAGVMVDIGVARDIGDAVDGVAQATRAATLADTDGAMPAGPTDAAMQVTTAMADTRVVMPVAADIRAAARYMEAVAITVADPTVAAVPTAEAVTAADTGNQH
jgi:hypothetical protein